MLYGLRMHLHGRVRCDELLAGKHVLLRARRILFLYELVPVLTPNVDISGLPLGGPTGFVVNDAPKEHASSPDCARFCERRLRHELDHAILRVVLEAFVGM